MVDAPDATIAFATRDALWRWLGEHGDTHQGAWVRLAKSGSGIASVTFHELLEAGIAFGWSESTRRSSDAGTYLQRFTPRRALRTSSARNLAIAARLEREGRMTEAGRRALGLTRPRARDSVDIKQGGQHGKQGE